MTKIVIEGKLPKNFILLEGFQGVGFVATIAAEYLAEKMKAEQIGYITSEELPPLIMFYNGKISHLIRIYKFKWKNQNFVLIVSELPIPSKLVHELSNEIITWAKKKGVKEIISFEGVVAPQLIHESEVYGISNGLKTKTKFSKSLKLLKNGIIVGMSAAILMKAKENKIPAFCMLAEAHPEFPDARAAAAIINKFNELYGTSVDTTELVEEAKEVEKKLMNVVQKAVKLNKRNFDDTKQYIG